MTTTCTRLLAWCWLLAGGSCGCSGGGDPPPVASSSAAPASSAASATAGASASASEPMFGPLELSRVDITQIKDFRGRDATVFGAKLGMTIEELETAVSRSGLVPKPDDDRPQDPMLRVGVFDKGPPEDELFAAYWARGDAHLQMIVLFEGMASRVVGKTKDLFAISVLDPKAPLRAGFLGEQHGQKKEEEKMLGYESTSYDFPERDIAIADTRTNGRDRHIVVTLALSKWAKM
jgi:hypothetical protein